ncbi:hypothetical protein DFJ74DRAFT_443352 [Hyaloraphidium curvatum]|nr:hypothetical protein DFJ74DRAFT_443352 [Hyaloraphidium curvatum]
MEPPTEPASAAPPPALLTREEWLACFPAAAPATGGLGTLPGPPDPAAALRDAAPLTQSSMLRALAPWPSMRAVLSAQFATGALHFAIMPAQLLTHFFNLAIMGAMFWFLEQANFAGFGRSNAVVGVTAGVVVNASGLLSYLVFLVSREARMEYLSWFEVKSLDYNYCAQAVRWSELCSGVLKHGEMEDGGCLGSFSKGRLVAHDPDDKLCPCPDERCAGQLLWQAAVAAASTALVVTTAAVTSMGVCMVWTPFVTLRLQFWSTWWSVLLAVVFPPRSSVHGHLLCDVLSAQPHNAAPAPPHPPDPPPGDAPGAVGPRRRLPRRAGGLRRGPSRLPGDRIRVRFPLCSHKDRMADPPQGAPPRSGVRGDRGGVPGRSRSHQHHRRLLPPRVHPHLAPPRLRVRLRHRHGRRSRQQRPDLGHHRALPRRPRGAGRALHARHAPRHLPRPAGRNHNLDRRTPTAAGLVRGRGQVQGPSFRLRD